MVTFTKNAGVQGQKWKKWKEIIQVLMKRSGDCQSAEIFKPKEMLCLFIRKFDPRFSTVTRLVQKHKLPVVALC